MTDIEPCLAGCDRALADAERLIATLSGSGTDWEPELGGFAERIAAVRREVERLRGMPTVRVRRAVHGEPALLSALKTPWCSADATDVSQSTKDSR